MMSRRNKHWSKEEYKFMLENIKEMGVSKIAKELGRSEKSIRNKLNNSGVSLMALKGKEMNYWSGKEVEFLTCNYHLYTVEELSEMLGRTKNAIARKKHELGLNEKHKKTISDKVRITVPPNNMYVMNYNRTTGVHRVHHRVLYEEYHNVELKDHQLIHHIDGDKQNNTKENLWLCENNSEHRGVHSQLEDMAYILIREGIINFDKETGLYYANPNRRLKEKERNINAN